MKYYSAIKKKKGSPTIWNNMHRPWKHYVKSERGRQILYNFTYMQNLLRKHTHTHTHTHTEKEIRLVAVRGRGWRARELEEDGQKAKTTRYRHASFYSPSLYCTSQILFLQIQDLRQPWSQTSLSSSFLQQHVLMLCLSVTLWWFSQYFKLFHYYLL